MQARGAGKPAHDLRGREIAASVVQEAGGDFDLTELLRELEEEMQSASANLEFERAALLRDQIMEVKSGTGLTKIEPKRKPVKYTRSAGRDDRGCDGHRAAALRGSASADATQQRFKGRCSCQLGKLPSRGSG